MANAAASRLGYAWFVEAPRLAVLETAGSTRKDWMHAGQAPQRVLLTATAHGIAAAPLTQPLETADAWLVRDPPAGAQQPQTILRLGYGPPVPAQPWAGQLGVPEVSVITTNDL